MMIYPRNNLRNGRLALPQQGAAISEAPHGVRTLGLDKDRDAILYVPKTYVPGKPAPFALLLHGAGGSAEHGLFLLKDQAELHNIVLLAPSSRGNTWDIIDGGVFGADVLLIQQAMEVVFQSCTIDTGRLAIGGFSDGASYALSLGLINGGLFTHIIAFSPGFFHAPTLTGKPAVFISHGVKDTVLPIQPCSRRIVPKLQQETYAVTYREFGDGHIVPDEIREEAINWFV
jgi:phospholipase/carboxylesterase